MGLVAVIALAVGWIFKEVAATAIERTFPTWGGHVATVLARFADRIERKDDHEYEAEVLALQYENADDAGLAVAVGWVGVATRTRCRRTALDAKVEWGSTYSDVALHLRETPHVGSRTWAFSVIEAGFRLLLGVVIRSGGAFLLLAWIGLEQRRPLTALLATIALPIARSDIARIRRKARRLPAEAVSAEEGSLLGIGLKLLQMSAIAVVFLCVTSTPWTAFLILSAVYGALELLIAVSCWRARRVLRSRPSLV